MIPKTRLQVFNKKADEGSFVAYWMIGARRAVWSHSLEHAIDVATQKSLPLVVIEPVFIGQKWANDRFHTFAIQGMLDNIESFEGFPVTYIPYIETKAGEADRLLDGFIEKAAVIVTDDVSVYYPKTIVEKLSEQNDCRVDVVDGNGFTALRAVPKEFGAAYHFRRHLQKTMVSQHLKEFPEPKPLAKSTDLPKIDKTLIDTLFESADAMQTSQKYLVRIGTNSGKQLKALKLLDIDHEVPPVKHYPGGSKAAVCAWKEFLSKKLGKYHEDRNHPEKNASSYLSPYLHFGHISAHFVVQEIFDKYNWTPKKIRQPHDGRREKWWSLPEGVEGFLDQIITWRDVGHLHCAWNPDHAKYESFSEWSKKTAKDHLADKRPRIYTFEELENAKTNDDLWNAAQTQLRTDGIIHNYLRMLWGKRVIEWTPDAQTALKYLIDLNDKWALDGRDPNSYCGIGWVLGKFDRGWTERPIYGKIRYMATENTKKKYKTTTYIATYSNSGLKRKTLMKKQTQLPLSFKKENKTSSENSDSSGADSPKKLKRVRDGPLSETESNKVPKVESKVEA